MQLKIPFFDVLTEQWLNVSNECHSNACLMWVNYSHQDRGGWANTVATTHFLGQLLQGDFCYLIRQ